MPVVTIFETEVESHHTQQNYDERQNDNYDSKLNIALFHVPVTTARVGYVPEERVRMTTLRRFAPVTLIVLHAFFASLTLEASVESVLFVDQLFRVSNARAVVFFRAMDARVKRVAPRAVVVGIA